MFDKLETVENRFVSIEESLAQPGLDGREMIRLTKERAEVLELVELYRKYKALKAVSLVLADYTQKSNKTYLCSY